MDSLILASKSPRRREILKKLGIPFISYRVRLKESDHYRSWVRSSVMNVSRKKVGAAAEVFARGLILGVDTVVCFNGKVLGKPKDADEAYHFISMLNGNKHRVLSGISLLDAHNGVSGTSVSTTTVYFDKMCKDDMKRYIDGGEWSDKAGGYAIQGQAALYIKSIVGSYYNVMGLPVEELFKLLKRFSYFESNGVFRPLRM
jgi:septum formation protein